MLIINAGIPHPNRGASVVLFYHYIKHLHAAGYNILNLLLIDKQHFGEAALTEYRTKHAPQENFQIEAYLHDQPLIHRSRFNITSNFPEELYEQIKGFQADIIVCFDTIPAWFAAKIPAEKKVVWLGDLHFQTEWHHALYAIRENPRQVTGIPFVWRSCSQWRQIYREALQDFTVVVSSKSSEQHMAALRIQAQYLPYPWPNEDVVTEYNPRKTPTFLFFGSLVGLGSRSAFHFMIKKVYPELVKLWGTGGFKIYITGMRQMPGWARDAIAALPEFEFLGFVDNLEDLLANCHAVMVPIRVPVGNRSRIVTAMAKGIPIVAHVNTRLGNPDLEDGVNCFLANNGRDFAKKMQRLYVDAELRQRIIIAAKDCYNRKFAPQTATSFLIDIIKDKTRV